ncbi:MAG TPA: hypothetical protein VD816_00230 [Ohtaekwangia sp.]|nr:hypothetical protein [Ohtaekwangia sp.]
MLKHLFYPCTLLLLVSCMNVWAQGCSDAGFCTMGAMKPDQPFNKKIALKLRSMEVSFYRGTTTLSPIVYVATADLNFSLNSRTSFQLKLPYQAVEGTLGKTSGMGDISLCFTRNIYSHEKFDVQLSVGTKIPTGRSDKAVDGLPLPMYYQTSLGTYDFITGVSVITRKWLFATGIQHPFNKNNNQFLWTEWQNGPENIEYVNRYDNARELKRGTDVMLRVERNFRFSRLNFSIGLLPIFRVTKDEIADATGERFKPDGASGMALSGIFTTGYNFNVRSGIKLLLGHKIVQRDENADGLTREFVSSISYCYRF